METLPRINENSGGKQEGISNGLGCRRYLIMLTHHLRVQYFRTNSANIFTRWHDMRVAYRPASIISVLLPYTIATSVVSRLHVRLYRELFFVTLIKDTGYYRRNNYAAYAKSSSFFVVSAIYR